MYSVYIIYSTQWLLVFDNGLCKLSVIFFFCINTIRMSSTVPQDQSRHQDLTSFSSMCLSRVYLLNINENPVHSDRSNRCRFLPTDSWRELHNSPSSGDRSHQTASDITEHLDSIKQAQVTWLEPLSRCSAWNRRRCQTRRFSAMMLNPSLRCCGAAVSRCYTFQSQASSVQIFV